jgi:hypothetical protein
MRIAKICFSLLYISLPILSLSADAGSEEFPPISREVQISLITGEPGEELYTKFGHSAIRVYDPAQGIDFVYNYGTFDFEASGFYRKFLQGKLLYFLSVYDFKRMVFGYNYRNQSLFEQVLNLTYEEKKAVYQFLNHNYLPENRYYPYDFFFDNCSSRIKDVFQDILGASLDFDDSHITDHKTFRQLLDEFLYENPWDDFGIDLILGIPTDATATSEEYMFLPYKLYNAFDNARIKRGDKYIPFVLSSNVIHQSINIPGASNFQLTPKALFWSLFFIILTLTFVFRSRIIMNKIMDSVLFITIGLAGWIIFLLWFATEHTATKDNMNLLWAFPFHIVIPYFIIRNTRRIWLNYYYIFWVIFLILFLGSWTILPQQINTANIPIILMLVVRFYFNYYNSNSNVEGRKQSIT